MSRDYETEDYSEDFEAAVAKYAHAIAPFWDKTRFPWKIAYFFFERGKEELEGEYHFKKYGAGKAPPAFTPLDPSTLPKVEVKK